MYRRRFEEGGGWSRIFPPSFDQITLEHIQSDTSNSLLGRYIGTLYLIDLAMGSKDVSLFKGAKCSDQVSTK